MSDGAATTPLGLGDLPPPPVVWHVTLSPPYRARCAICERRVKRGRGRLAIVVTDGPRQFTAHYGCIVVRRGTT